MAVVPTQAQGVPAYDHVFTIVMENTSYNSIIGNPAAPYINSLAASGGLARAYFGVTHPSLPNYLALTGGDTFGITSDCTTCWLSAPNIADSLENNGSSWKAYLEAMPSPCFVGDSYPYAQKHNPFIYYNDIRTNASRCQSHVVPYSQLSNDLRSAATTPNYAFITPDMCNDMHDCSTATGDSWLQQQVPQILSSPAFTTQKSLLALTWDEDDFSGTNNVPLILVGSGIGAGATSAVTYNHYSLLRTVELARGLPALTSNDASQGAITDLFSNPVPACTSASISPSLSSPQTAGATVTFTAGSAGCANPQYRFWELDPGSRWSIVQDYSPANTFTWRSPASAGAYRFEVDVRDASAAVAYETLASLSFTLQSGSGCTAAGINTSPASPGATGAAITLSGTSSACPNPVYRFWIRDPGSRWSMVQDYSPATTHLWSQTYFGGATSLEVDVRDASESTVYDVVANITYVTIPCSAAGMTPSSNSVSHGTPITLVATSTCQGTPTYRFWVRAPGASWQIVQDYGMSNTFSWAPPAAGTYSLEVDVRDQNVTQVYEVVYNVTYSVT